MISAIRLDGKDDKRVIRLGALKICEMRGRVVSKDSVDFRCGQSVKHLYSSE